VGGSVISDSRILADDGRTVVIGTKNYREGGRREPLAMPGVEFARRFVLHIAPQAASNAFPWRGSGSRSRTCLSQDR
jgi:hypothetical protein